MQSHCSDLSESTRGRPMRCFLHTPSLPAGPKLSCCTNRTCFLVVCRGQVPSDNNHIHPPPGLHSSSSDLSRLLSCASAATAKCYVGAAWANPDITACAAQPAPNPLPWFDHRHRKHYLRRLLFHPNHPPPC